MTWWRWLRTNPKPNRGRGRFAHVSNPRRFLLAATIQVPLTANPKPKPEEAPSSGKTIGVFRCRNRPCTESGEGGCPPIDVGNGVTTESAPNIWRWRTAVEHHAGIDVSLELSSVCVVDGRGRIVRGGRVAREPEALVSFFKGLGLPVKLIGLEAGPLSQWLHAGLMRAGFEAVLLETRHVKAALSAMTVKTDRKDARGLAQLIRMGWFRPVHAKIDRIAGDPGAAGCAQAASRKVGGRGIEHSGNPARLRPEGRPGDAQNV